MFLQIMAGWKLTGEKNKSICCFLNFSLRSQVLYLLSMRWAVWGSDCGSHRLAQSNFNLFDSFIIRLVLTWGVICALWDSVWIVCLDYTDDFRYKKSLLYRFLKCQIFFRKKKKTFYTRKKLSNYTKQLIIMRKFSLRFSSVA